MCYRSADYNSLTPPALVLKGTKSSTLPSFSLQTTLDQLLQNIKFPTRAQHLNLLRNSNRSITTQKRKTFQSFPIHTTATDHRQSQSPKLYNHFPLITTTRARCPNLGIHKTENSPSDREARSTKRMPEQGKIQPASASTAMQRDRAESRGKGTILRATHDGVARQKPRSTHPRREGREERTEGGGEDRVVTSAIGGVPATADGQPKMTRTQKERERERKGEGIGREGGRGICNP